MTKNNKIALPNSLLLVMDKDAGEIPELMSGKLIVATPSCIAVSTLSEADGETSITLTDDEMYLQEVPGVKQVFSGVLATPKKRLDLCTVEHQPVLTIPVSNTESHLEIWANHKTEPDKLWVLVTS